MDPQPPLVLQCDGTPPKLVNQDKQSYDYEIQCGAKTEKSTISAGAEQELKKKAGCLLKLGKNGPAKLHTEMVCTIKDGALKCDLL